MKKLICKMFDHIFIEDARFMRSRIIDGHCKRCGKNLQKFMEVTEVEEEEYYE